MTIAQVKLFRYRLPLVGPVTFLGTPMTVREGLVICLSDQSGHSGFGECAPLPGYSRENLETAGRQLASIGHRLKRVEVDPSSPLEAAADVCDESTVSSVRFAVESAFVSLTAVVLGQTVASVLAPDYTLEVPVNALIESGDNIISRLSELSAHNCAAAKLKVGRQSVTDDIALVRQVRQHLPEQISLRLDANRHWTFDQATRFAEGIAGCAIEYIEEPLKDFARLPEFHESVGDLSLAIDESVRDLAVESIQSDEYYAAVVIKPTVVGGIARYFEIVRACKRSGKKPVPGAAIESSLGLQMIAQMAATQINCPPIGLDTARLFARDLVEPPLAIVDYKVNIDEESSAPVNLNYDLLEEVSLG